MFGLAQQQATVSGAVRLRQWLLGCLAGQPDREPPRICRAAQRICLEAERCAVPLLRRIGSGVALPAETRQQIASRCEAENRRIQSARVHLETASGIAREHGWRLVALKGTMAAATTGCELDLVDVDLLLPPESARTFARELDQRGYWPFGHSHPRHLTQRTNGSLLPVEIHVCLDHDGASLGAEVWDRIRPLESWDGLWRLSATDHLWHLLEHVTVDHPERCGLIRELLLIGVAAVECSDREMEHVRSRVSGHPRGDMMRTTLQMAEDLYGRRLVGDPLAGVTAIAYAVRTVLLGVPLPRVLEPHVYKWSFGLLLGRAARRRLWNDIWVLSLEYSLGRYLGWLERRTGRLGKGYRILLRLVRGALAIALALPVAFVAGRLARRAVADT